MKKDKNDESGCLVLHMRSGEKLVAYYDTDDELNDCFLAFDTPEGETIGFRNCVVRAEDVSAIEWKTRK